MEMSERTNPAVLLRGVNNPTRLLAEVQSEGQQRTLGCLQRGASVLFQGRWRQAVFQVSEDVTSLSGAVLGVGAHFYADSSRRMTSRRSTDT